jgi:hypothetical protein
MLYEDQCSFIIMPHKMLPKINVSDNIFSENQNTKFIYLFFLNHALMKQYMKMWHC